jgi:hypothetical protein
LFPAFAAPCRHCRHVLLELLQRESIKQGRRTQRRQEVAMDIAFLILGLALWGLMALLVRGLQRLAPSAERRP